MGNDAINWDEVPDIINKEQLYRLCHIGKVKAQYLLQNNLIPCEYTGKMTRCYKIKKEDVRTYLERRDQFPEDYSPPGRWYVCLRPSKSQESPEEVAAEMRRFYEEKLADYCGGDSSYLDDTSVLAIRDRVREKYAADAQKQIQEERSKSAALTRDVEIAVNKAESIQKGLHEVTEKIQDEISNLYQRTETNARKGATIGATISKWTITAVVIAVAVIAIGATIIDAIFRETVQYSYLIVAIVSIISVISVVALLSPIFSLPTKIYKITYQKVFDLLYSRNISKIKPQIERLQAILGKQN